MPFGIAGAHAGPMVVWSAGAAVMAMLQGADADLANAATEVLALAAWGSLVAASGLGVALVPYLVAHLGFAWRLGCLSARWCSVWSWQVERRSPRVLGLCAWSAPPVGGAFVSATHNAFAMMRPSRQVTLKAAVTDEGRW